jgi:hypothetical protein
MPASSAAHAAMGRPRSGGPDVIKSSLAGTRAPAGRSKARPEPLDGERMGYGGGAAVQPSSVRRNRNATDATRHYTKLRKRKRVRSAKAYEGTSARAEATRART